MNNLRLQNLDDCSKTLLLYPNELLREVAAFIHAA